jgi:hypothetical protein
MSVGGAAMTDGDCTGGDERGGGQRGGGLGGDGAGAGGRQTTDAQPSRGAGTRAGPGC